MYWRTMMYGISDTVVFAFKWLCVVNTDFAIAQRSVRITGSRIVGWSLAFTADTEWLNCWYCRSDTERVHFDVSSTQHSNRTTRTANQSMSAIRLCRTQNQSVASTFYSNVRYTRCLSAKRFWDCRELFFILLYFFLIITISCVWKTKTTFGRIRRVGAFFDRDSSCKREYCAVDSDNNNTIHIWISTKHLYKCVVRYAAFVSMMRLKLCFNRRKYEMVGICAFVLNVLLGRGV